MKYWIYLLCLLCVCVCVVEFTIFAKSLQCKFVVICICLLASCSRSHKFRSQNKRAICSAKSEQRKEWHFIHTYTQCIQIHRSLAHLLRHRASNEVLGKLMKTRSVTMSLRQFSNKKLSAIHQIRTLIKVFAPELSVCVWVWCWWTFYELKAKANSFHSQIFITLWIVRTFLLCMCADNDAPLLFCWFVFLSFLLLLLRCGPFHCFARLFFFFCSVCHRATNTASLCSVIYYFVTFNTAATVWICAYVCVLCWELFKHRVRLHSPAHSLNVCSCNDRKKTTEL